jgi:TolA-binding protein
MGKQISIFLIIFFNIFSLSAQQTLNRLDSDYQYRLGLELVEKKKYNAAREALETYLRHPGNDLNRLDAQYFIAYSALRLYHNDGEKLLNDFVENNENHPKAKVAYYELGNFYFKEKNFRKAIRYFEAADPAHLKSDQRAEARFKIGYSYFGFKEFDRALPHFNHVKTGTNPFTHAASYYAGYIEYTKGDYQEALADFERAAQNESYTAVVPYLIVNIYNKQKKYDELIKYSESVLGRGDVRNREEIMMLAGDAYFHKGNYAKAIEYLSGYVGRSKVRAPADIYYKLGYSQYQTGRNNEAIESFKLIALNPDTVGQFASYYLGILYVKDNNRLFAVTAFERAKASNFNEEIKKEATFNFAKVSYELGKYAEAIAAFKDYVSRYPAGERVREANDLISESFLRTTNYDLAIEHIESQRNKSERMRQVYQQVTYYKGIELFNSARYPQAVQMFQKSLSMPNDKSIAAQAYLWMGEAYSIGERYEDAINAYAGVFRTVNEQDQYSLRARYGIGYAYYNSMEYEKALPHFREFVNRLDRNNQRNIYYQDALVRLGDCYYATKDYNNAISTFDRAIGANIPEVDYAYYQRGVVQGITGNLQGARTSLNTVLEKYPNSRHRASALFELAQIDFENGNYAAASDGFSRLISQQPQSHYVPYAYLRRALSNYNLKNYSSTIADYKHILNNFVSHLVSNSALLGLQEVLAIEGQSDQMEPFLVRFKQANPDSKDIKSIEFEAAKNLYFSQNYDRAITAFTGFIRTYPGGEMETEAKYFIGDSYYRNNDAKNALQYFYEVIREPNAKDRNRAISRIAELEYYIGNYNVAITYYKRLLDVAMNKRDESFGWTGLMESYFQIQKYDSVNYFANMIIDRGAVSANAENKAKLFLGKSAYERKNYNEAIDHFMNTLNAAKDESGAEAQYLMADILYKKQDYKQSIQTLYDLNEKFSFYELWLGRSFLLIADNFIALDEMFQAKATLNSVAEKSKIESIREEAVRKLRQLEQQERQRLPEQDTSIFQQTQDN